MKKSKKIVSVKKATHPDLQIKNLMHLCIQQKVCRMCKSSKMSMYLDLGFTPPADQFRKPEELQYPEVSYPLRVMLCESCGLSQLSHVVDPRVLYQYDYPYESSTTKTGKKHWDEFASLVVKRLALKKNDLVIDIGSNVGTLLSSFRDLGMKIYGIDPAPNIVKIANESGVPTLCAFFNQKSALAAGKKAGKAKVIVGTNVFAHIDDLHEVMKAAQKLLTPDGVFIFESPHFEHLVENLEYDTVYHEHLSYLSVKPLIPFFKKFKMEVFAVEESDIHGGSMRVYVGRIGKHMIDKNVMTIIKREDTKGLHDMKELQKFAKRVEENRTALTTLVEKLLHDGKKVVAVSAPAKGMTLLNYNGFTNRHLPYVAEKARLKIGRHTPGGKIPVVPDEYFMNDDADYALLLAWNFSKEIMANLQAFRDRGGKFIIPIPVPKIV